jgi:hypothetical protein
MVPELATLKSGFRDFGFTLEQESKELLSQVYNRLYE